MPPINLYTPFIGKRGDYLYRTFFNSGQGRSCFSLLAGVVGQRGKSRGPIQTHCNNHYAQNRFPVHGRKFCRSGIRQKEQRVLEGAGCRKTR
jgi:hypothetical protein